MKRWTWLLTVALLLAPAAAAVACPMCKDSVQEKGGVVIGHDGEGGGGTLPGGFNQNVYYMLSALAIVMGGVLGMIWRTVRQTDARNGSAVIAPGKDAHAFPVVPAPKKD